MDYVVNRLSRRPSGLAWVACVLGVLAPAGAGHAGRTLTFVNQCAEPVWFGATGGFTQNCGSGNTCPAGQACLTTRNPPGCFWSLPAPSGGNKLAASGGTASVALNAPPSGNVAWSGNVYGATGCNAQGANCQTAACVGGTCPPGTGVVGPATLAEFTLLTNGADTYDVSLINGVNLPVSMAPTAGQQLASSTSVYWCGNPGGPTPTNSALQGCSWSFNPTVGGNDQSTVLQMVAPGGKACTKSSDCSSGQVCGQAMTVGTTTVTQSCGALIGWWTAAELCTFTNSAFGAPINCGTSVSGQGNQGNLYLCNGANGSTCYGGSPGTTCCGCPQWVVNGKALQATASCLATNASWTSIAQPWAQFAKNACPTGYSFQFDDPTSTFQCMTQGSTNSTNYTITFCPGGTSIAAAKR
jgi:hypothetical protein